MVRPVPVGMGGGRAAVASRACAFGGTAGVVGADQVLAAVAQSADLRAVPRI